MAAEGGSPAEAEAAAEAGAVKNALREIMICDIMNT